MGFGGAAARLFAREGAKVVLTDINLESGQKTTLQINESGGEAKFLRLDVTEEQDWTDTVGATVASYGMLDILVNNAGTGARYTVEGTTEEVWDTQMNIHAKGTFLGTKHAIPEMRKVGSDTSTVYHAAKGAIRLFTKSAAIQYAKENIRVNSVHPGFAHTPLTQRGYANPEYLERILSRIPMGRVGTADDIAYGMLYLASDESSFVTGSELVIDGGTTAQ